MKSSRGGWGDWKGWSLRVNVTNCFWVFINSVLWTLCQGCKDSHKTQPDAEPSMWTSVLEQKEWLWDRRGNTWSKLKLPEKEHLAFAVWFSPGHSPQITGLNQATEHNVGFLSVSLLLFGLVVSLLFENGSLSSVLANLEITIYNPDYPKTCCEPPSTF